MDGWKDVFLYYPVVDLMEGDLDGCFLDVLMLGGVVNELLEFLKTHPGRFLAEDEEQRLD